MANTLRQIFKSIIKIYKKSLNYYNQNRKMISKFKK